MFSQKVASSMQYQLIVVFLLCYLVQRVFQRQLGHTAYIHDLIDPEEYYFNK